MVVQSGPILTVNQLRLFIGKDKERYGLSDSAHMNSISVPYICRSIDVPSYGVMVIRPHTILFQIGRHPQTPPTGAAANTNITEGVQGR